MFCRQERWVVFFAFRRAGKLGNPFRLSSWTRTKYTGPAARRFQAVAAAGPAIEPKTLQLRRSESASVSAHIGALIHGRLARGLRVGVGGDTGGRGALYRGFSGRGRSRAGSLCSEIVTSVAVENCHCVVGPTTRLDGHNRASGLELALIDVPETTSLFSRNMLSSPPLEPNRERAAWTPMHRKSNGR